jgi:hypothetical protein
MHKHIDLTGQKFTRLTVTAYLGPDGHGHTSYLALCDCGNQIKVFRGNLLKGTSRSCGCLRIDRMRKLWADRKAATGVKHGQ